MLRVFWGCLARPERSYCETYFLASKDCSSSTLSFSDCRRRSYNFFFSSNASIHFSTGLILKVPVLFIKASSRNDRETAPSLRVVIRDIFSCLLFVLMRPARRVVRADATGALSGRFTYNFTAVWVLPRRVKFRGGLNECKIFTFSFVPGRKETKPTRLCVDAGI